MTTGDPATQVWQQATGDLQAKLAASQQDLSRMQDQRDRFIKAADKLHGEWLDLKADLTRAEQDLAEEREKVAELAAALAAARDQLAHAGQCAWRGIAEDLMREREQNEENQT